MTFILAMVILVIMSSCTKPEKQIIGKWKITYAKVEGEGFIDKSAVGETWNFKENGTFTGCMSKEVEITCNWFLNGEELVLKGGDLEYSGEHSGESGSVWSDNSEVVYTFDLDLLDKDNLVVSGKARSIYTSTSEYGDTFTHTQSWSVSYELEAK